MAHAQTTQPAPAQRRRLTERYYGVLLHRCALENDGEWCADCQKALDRAARRFLSNEERAVLKSPDLRRLLAAGRLYQHVWPAAGDRLMRVMATWFQACLAGDGAVH